MATWSRTIAVPTTSAHAPKMRSRGHRSTRWEPSSRHRPHTVAIKLPISAKGFEVQKPISRRAARIICHADGAASHKVDAPSQAQERLKLVVLRTCLTCIWDCSAGPYGRWPMLSPEA
eukprot:78654-Prymnesium_polylepis.1